MGSPELVGARVNQGLKFTAALKEQPQATAVDLVLGQAISRVHGEVGCSLSFSYGVTVSLLVGLPGFGEGLWSSVNPFLPFSLCLFLCLWFTQVL